MKVGFINRIISLYFGKGKYYMNLKKTLAIGMAALMMVGCSSGSADGASDNTDAASSVVVAINADLNTMDHHVATDGGSFVMQSLCIGGLAELDADAQPVPDLAESWEVSEDGKTYTFHIREGLKWSNGADLTANDFVYGWRRLVEPELASEYNFIMETIGVTNAHACVNGEVALEELGVEATDDLTFVVHLDQPCGFMLGLMAFPSFFPLNQEFFEAHKDTYAQSIDDLIYCGPYVFSKWEANTEYTFTKNPDYWNAEAQAACVDEVVFRFVTEAQSSALAYQKGDVDVATLTGDLVDQYGSDPGFTQRLQGYAWRININQAVADETRAAAFNNVNFRKALSLSIDREKIATEVLKDGSVAAEGFIPKEFAFGPDGNDYRVTAGNILTEDLDAAKEALAKAKEELGVDTFEFSLLYETDSEAPGKVCTVLKQMWEENLEGVTVNLDSKTKKERLALMNELDYDLGFTRWGPDYADPQTYLDLFKSNISGYNNYYFNADYDALLDKAETGADAADPEARWQDMIDAEKMIIDDMGIVPVFQNGGAMLINPSVTGIEFHNAGVDSYRHIKKA